MIAQNSIVQSKWAKDPRCVLLMHMNGENDGTIFLDESPSPKTITRYGDTCTKTATKRLGVSSAYFDGTDYLTIPDSNDFYFGSSDFTIMVYVKLQSPSTTQTVICQANSSGNYYSNTIRIVSGVPTFEDQTIAAGANNVLAPTISDTNWHQLVVIRNGSSLQHYNDGVSGTPISVSGSTYNSETPFTIGRYGDYNDIYLNGYIDELVIWNGVAIPIEDLYPARAPLYDYAISEWSGQ